MTKSNILFQRAINAIPGGVNSPVRAFKSVGGDPIFIKHAKDAYIFDTNDKKYIDFVGSWGPMILGHANDKVIEAVQKTASLGLSFGAPTEIETMMAEKVKEIYPSIELVRMVSSGTEATMSAIRLARGYTGRNKIIKFKGCYHGHADSLLVDAGSGALTLGVPNSLGVTTGVAKDTIVLTYNHLEEVQQVFNENSADIAAIIVEPIAGNMNCIIPDKSFLQGLRDLCDLHKSVLIFDEVMTGFRVSLGGAQEYFNIKPDLTTLGKIIGGGMPVGAFGGKKIIMDYMAPLGGVYQAGTLSGNPLAMAAGLTTLELISESIDFYEKLYEKAKKLTSGLQSVANTHNIPMAVTCIGGMFGFFFSDVKTIRDFEDVQKCDIQLFNKFFHGMLDNGIYFAPSAFEAGFVSIAHSDADIEYTIKTADLVFSKC